MEGHAGAPTRPSLLNWNLALLQSRNIFVSKLIPYKSKRGLHSCRLRTHYNNIVVMMLVSCYFLLMLSL